jgi:hypothetical protein
VQASGEHARCAHDAAQLAFELGVILAGTNVVSVLHDDQGAIERARTAIENRLSR